MDSKNWSYLALPSRLQGVTEFNIKFNCYKRKIYETKWYIIFVGVPKSQSLPKRRWVK